MDVQQGNVFTESEVKRLHKGMSKAQVRRIMGAPLIQNIFDGRRIDYVYTNQPGGQTMQLKRVTLHFNSSGKVSSIDKEYSDNA